jgi:hypothetical protein
MLDALRLHMELEETHVDPLVHRSADERLAAEAEAEYELARDGVAQLEELSPDEPGFHGALTMVVVGIEHHVAEEEAEVFPALALELGSDKLADLAERLTAAGATLLAERSDRAGGHDKRSRPARPKRHTAPSRTPRSRQRRQVDPVQARRAELWTEREGRDRWLFAHDHRRSSPRRSADQRAHGPLSRSPAWAAPARPAHRRGTRPAWQSRKIASGASPVAGVDAVAFHRAGVLPWREENAGPTGAAVVRRHRPRRWDGRSWSA